MGKSKRKAKVKSLRGYATSSVASKNEELGVTAERQAVIAAAEAAHAAAKEEKAAMEAANAANAAAEKGSAGPQGDAWAEPGDTENAAEPGAFNNEEDSWLTSGLQAITIARKKLSKRRKVKSAGDIDPILELAPDAEEDTMTMLREVGLLDDVSTLGSWTDVTQKKIDKVWKEIIGKPRLRTRLLTAIIELEDLGFTLEQATMAVERCGLDVPAAMDWLVLHLPQDDLPPGWDSEDVGSTGPITVIGGGNSKDKGKGKQSLRQSRRTGRFVHPTPPPNTDPNARASKSSAKPDPAAPPIVPEPSDKEKEASKQRILRLIALQQEEEEQAALEEVEQDPAIRLEQLHERFVALRKDGKALTDKAGRKAVGQMIASVKTEMEALRSAHPKLKSIVFEEAIEEPSEPSAISVSETTGSNGDAVQESGNDEDDEGDDNGESGDFMASMFDVDAQADTVTSSSVRASDDSRVPVDLIPPPGSKKPAPTQILEQHIKSTWGKKQIRYNWRQEGNSVFQCSVSFKQWTFDMEDHEISSSKKLSADYVALKALYQIAKDYNYHLQMCQTSRELWFSWKTRDVDLAAEKERNESRARLQAVSDLEHRYESLAYVRNPRAKATFVEDGSNAFTSNNDNDDFRPVSKRFMDEDGTLSDALKTQFEERMKSAKYQEYDMDREELPVMGIRDQMFVELECHDVLIVSGSTGSGKTTQIPHLLLANEMLHGNGARTNIVVTEPRRISAVSVAERVSVELGETTGAGGPDSFVGYQIRGQKRVSGSCKVVYCTTGVILRQLQSDPLLSNYSHIVIDEVHERTVDGDLMLAILKRVVRERRREEDPLKIILMSATIDLFKLSEYFDNAPVVQAGGRTFPVSIFPLEDAIELTSYVCETESEFSLTRANRWRGGEVRLNDYPLEAGYSDITQEALANIDESRINYDLIERILILLTSQDKRQVVPDSDGPAQQKFWRALDDLENSGESSSNAILVFLPGLSQIQALYDRLSGHPHFASRGRNSGCVIYRLHSSLSSQSEQAQVFRVPPRGVQKIILSTNVAETGVTIPDVCYVIDTGKVKEMRFKAKTRMQSLEEVYVSKASLMQRAGRAGRTRPGICFQLLSSHLQEERLHPFGIPEMLRVSLEAVLLQLMTTGQQRTSDPWKFLSTCLDPPAPKAIDAAALTLEELGAVTSDVIDEDPLDKAAKYISLTPLGVNLSKLPVDAKIGKLLLIGALFHCLDPVLTVAASIGSEDQKVFLNQSQSNNTEVHKKFTHPISDLLTQHVVYRSWSQAVAQGKDDRHFCRNNQLSLRSLQQIRKAKLELLKLLQSSGFCSKDTRIDRFQEGAKSISYPTDDKANKNSQNDALLCAVLCAGLYPNLARPHVKRSTKTGSSVRTATPKRGSVLYTCKGEERVSLVPRSTNTGMLGPNEPFTGRNTSARTGVLCFLTKMKTSKTMLFDSTFVPPTALVMLTGAPLEISAQSRTLLVDWVPMHASPRTVAVLKRVREAINIFLEHHFSRGDSSSSPFSTDGPTLPDVVVKLVTF